MTFREALQQARPLLADGATGTMLQTLGLAVGDAPERWTLEKPEVVQTLAHRYTEAGAELVYTNTFGANRVRLTRVGLAGKLETLNRQAVELARAGIDAAVSSSPPGVGPWVVGSIGPTGELLEPYGDLSPEVARHAFAEQAAVLAGAGVDLIVCESFTDLDEVLLCLQAIQTVTDVPVLGGMSFEESGRTMMGVTPEEAVTCLTQAGAGVAGANCSTGPEVVEQALQAMQQAAPDTLLLAKPNAGLPQLVDGRPVYPVGPEAMAAFAQRMKAMGVAVIGGCCGTTPEHIAAMAGALDKRI